MAGITAETAVASAITSTPTNTYIQVFVPNSGNPSLYDAKLATKAAFVGPAGATGPTGSTGPAGPTGPAGASGAPNITGITAISVTTGAQRMLAFETDGTPKVASLPSSRVGINQGAVALTAGTSVATNAALGNVFTLTPAQAFTLANPTNLVAGATYMWVIKQDTTGGRLVTWGTAFKWAGGTAGALSTLGNAVDILTGYSDGTNLYVVLTKGFA